MDETVNQVYDEKGNLVRPKAIVRQEALKKGEVRAMDEKVQKKREELVKKIEEALKGNSLEDQNAAVARAYSIIHKKYMVARGPVKK